MHRGYIKLWRKVTDSKIYRNRKLWALWTWLLMNATHKEINIYAGLEKVKLLPGQIITGRKALAEELAMSEQNIRTCLQLLEKHGNLTIKSTNRFSIITIVNWDIYQSDDEKLTSKPTSIQPASNQQVTTKQEHKNVKHIRKNIEHPDWLNLDLWNEFKKYRKSIKAPLTEHAEKLLITELKKLIDAGNDQTRVINQTICSGKWKGFYPDKNNGCNAKGWDPNWRDKISETQS